jgi:hypothetical protein
MSLSLEEYFHDFRQNLLSSAEAREDFLEAEFALITSRELEDSSSINGFESCQYKAVRGMRVDGYWYNDDGFSLDLFIVDFANREKLESLTKTDADVCFKRLENFFISSAEKALYQELEETSLGYGLARDISAHCHTFTRINFYLISERRLSNKVSGFEEKKHRGWTFQYHIWDITRLHRISTARGGKEEVVINFSEMFGEDIQCLPAHIDSNEYESFLLVMPAKVLADLYDKHGDRLLEQNVRCFLQARAKVNKGIRHTIMTDPGKFFAYNNGITATAKEVIIKKSSVGIFISEIKDLQIVNGGQTMVSLFLTNRKDNAPLDKIFVQMKLSVVDSEKEEEVIPRISEYANTQNKVNAADFFSNHPFHIRIEEFSRRLWAPAVRGATRESKWFYERARGQYSNAQAKLSNVDKKKFLADFPLSQMFSKTDLAKFENVWDEKPTHVNYGAQKNFAQFARRIGQEWDKNSDRVNEFYYKRLIARAIIFKRLEKMVPNQTWYNGGYRANIVAYTLAMISKLCAELNKSFDFLKVWENQDINETTTNALLICAKIVHDDIINPPPGIANISEWCKKEDCWIRLQNRVNAVKSALPAEFLEALISHQEVKAEIKSSAKVQKIDLGIEAQKKVFEISVERWKIIALEGLKKKMFSSKEQDILAVAVQMPNKIPSDKQSLILLEILNKATLEGIVF